MEGTECYLQQVGPLRALSRQEEQGLAFAVRDLHSEVARCRLIESNLRFVLFVARRYVGHGLDYSELVQEGNIGLIQAVDRFDPDRGVRLTTYAAWWIKLAIEMALTRTGPLHVPRYMVQSVLRWKRATERFRQRVGRPPSPFELAAEMQVPVDRVWAIARAARGTRDIVRVRCVDGECVHDPVMLASDEREEASEQRVARGESGLIVRRLLEALRPRDAEIVRERFGLDGRAPQTCREIARVHGVTGERVRQIVRDVLFALRVRAREQVCPCSVLKM